MRYCLPDRFVREAFQNRAYLNTVSKELAKNIPQIRQTTDLSDLFCHNLKLILRQQDRIISLSVLGGTIA